MKTQTRGNCQCCGRDQAVLASGCMSQHGYTVDHGWFNGVCHGHHYKPLQQDRTATDAMVNQIHSDVAKLREQLAGLESGTLKPATARPNRWDYRPSCKEVPFDQAPADCQQLAVDSAKHKVEGRIAAGLQFARFMADLANKVFGQPLMTVEVRDAQPRVLRGQKRVNGVGNVFECLYTQGQRVYWVMDGRKGWTGLRAWREMKAA